MKLASSAAEKRNGCRYLVWRSKPSERDRSDSNAAAAVGLLVVIVVSGVSTAPGETVCRPDALWAGTQARATGVKLATPALAAFVGSKTSVATDRIE